MQAIQTKWLGPTNTRGSRVKAFSEAFPLGVIVSWDYALGVEENHDNAARAFINAKEWHGVWARGSATNSQGNVYVCVARDVGGVYSDRCVKLMAILPNDATLMLVCALKADES